MVNFWRGKRVFITGHTGFKGSWLCLWLTLLGAKVTGYALKPPTKPSLFEVARVDDLVNSITGDIRNLPKLKAAFKKADPQIIFHLAAQPIVRESYKVPVETYDINVMGTVNLLEAARALGALKAIVNVTTDKVYDLEKSGVKQEDDELGGYDPYSSSKACSEIVTAAYRSSYFQDQVAVATARAGNVIGGGDWASDRLVPDFFRAILKGRKILIRNPKAIRPWQHVLEPLGGYLRLAELLFAQGSKFSQAWNFGPRKSDAQPVEYPVKKLCHFWRSGAGYVIDHRQQPHEADYLRLDISKAATKLGWKPKWGLDKALNKTTEWFRAYQNGTEMRDFSIFQIKEYSHD